MDKREVAGEFINSLQLILNKHIPNVDRDEIDDIKADADEALTEVLQKYERLSKNSKGIISKYSREIREINYKLDQLEKGRIYDPESGKLDKADGYLSTNISQLKKMLNDLITKIEFGRESDEERLVRELSNFEI